MRIIEKHRAIKKPSSQPQILFNSPKPPLPRTYHIRKVCTSQVQQIKKRLVLEQNGGGDIEHMPTLKLSDAEIESTGLRVTDLLVLGKLCTSKSDARRTIEGGGVLMNDAKVNDVYAAADPAALESGIILKKGKKGFLRVIKG